MPRAVLLALALLAATTAKAQPEASSPARQRTASRRARRDARRTPTPYPDSHLDMTRQPLRRGEPAPVAPTAGEPKFDRDGTPHVTEPKHPGLRLRKHKTDSFH